MAAAAGRPVLPPVQISPKMPGKTRRTLRKCALISAFSAQSIEFWHAWGWFGYGACAGKRPDQGNGSKKTAEGTCSFLIFCGNVRHEPDVFHKSAINTAKLSMITFIDGFGGIKSNCNAEEEYCKIDLIKPIFI
jgi:hypothetical protein